MERHRSAGCENIHPNIYRITLPLTGKMPGPVHTYLFTGGQPALIDTGTRKTAGILERALQEKGLSFSDIRQIVLTHGHIDHYGAARIIVRGSAGKARVAAHKEDRKAIESGLEVPRRQLRKFFRLMGVPVTFQLSLFLLRHILSFWADNCRVDRFLSEGEKVTLGNYEATVICTPGHTRGSISLYLEKEGLLFSGDQLLAHITPNAFAMLESDNDLPERMSQIEYFHSLAKLEGVTPRMVHPAHGAPISDIQGVADLYRKRFRMRQKRILSILGDSQFTAYQIGRMLFPGIRGFRLSYEIFLIVSEVYTHLQVLQKEQLVTSRLNHRAIRFERL